MDVTNLRKNVTCAEYHDAGILAQKGIAFFSHAVLLTKEQLSMARVKNRADNRQVRGNATVCCSACVANYIFASIWSCSRLDTCQV